MIIGKAHVCTEMAPYDLKEPDQRFFQGDVWECRCGRRFVLLEALKIQDAGRDPAATWWHYTWNPYNGKTEDELKRGA